MPEAPFAPRIDHVRVLHGIRTVDPFAWMGHDGAELSEVIDAENAYTTEVERPWASLRETLFGEIKDRVVETDLSVPVRHGEWWYRTRTIEGLAYPIHTRLPVSDHSDPPDTDAPDTVILDENVIAQGHDYSQVGATAISPDGAFLAWTVDHTGDESHTLYIRDLSRGIDLTDTIEGVSYGLAWSADSEHVFYTTMDATMRPDQVHRHRLGTDPDADVTVFGDDDERFFVHVESNRSDDWIVISAQSAVTGEVHLLDAHDPTGPLRCVAPRVQGVEVSVEAHRDRIFVLTNADGAEDFALFAADPNDLDAPMQPVIAHERGVRLEGCDAFTGHLVVHLRRGGSTGIRVITLATGATREIGIPDAVGTIAPGANAEFDTDVYRFSYQSLVTPPSVFDEDLSGGDRVLRKRLEVEGGYDPDDYTTERAWVDAPDGVAVPVTIVHRRDLPRDRPAPCMLYGYGAYEISVDPWFSVARLSLLDRGWVYAIAHVRGGGEMGRHWYTDGKFAAKPNSFTDFVACADHLVDAGLTAHDRLVIRGASAGGLLVGAALNLAPESFAAAIAEVPFVDPLNTLLDPTLPLTVTEWEEWGDPISDPDAAATIASYSPYENIRPLPYPAVLATAGVHDPRVGVHEPIKWVQRLREVTTGDAPIILKIETSGHGGPTGRYDEWRDEASILAFAIKQVAD
ncbi:MAG: S9 family peptidase [Actinobacteria bacterium]|nr:S9 family peptidase [Actinomycetota bacterium]